MARLGKRERVAKRALIAGNVATMAQIATERKLHGLRSTADHNAFLGRTHRNGYGAGMSTSRTSIEGTGTINVSKSRF